MVMFALLPKSPATVGIGEAEATGLGTGATEGEALGEAPDEEVPPLQAASSARGRTTSKPAIRRITVRLWPDPSSTAQTQRTDSGMAIGPAIRSPP
ncbi:hypothetical protein GCM10010430_15570 [Kitasatospora cystarginea]|uniref:Uncharacterized protein n=1 Tax=Kitasatospora cystarginea TaxID=58350 RepID=A0ABP5QK49_9ACTN